jgi:hypothetical protein
MNRRLRRHSRLFVLAHQPLHLLAVNQPAALVQLQRDAAAAVIAELQSNALDLVAQFGVPSDRSSSLG